MVLIPVVVFVTPFTVPSTSVSSSAKLIKRDFCRSVKVLRQKENILFEVIFQKQYNFLVNAVQIHKNFESYFGILTLTWM